MEEREKEIFYLEQLRNYYMEILTFLILVISVALGAPAWVVLLLWGISLVYKGNKLGLFEKLWEQYAGDWEKNKLKDLAKKYEKKMQDETNQEDIKNDAKSFVKKPLQKQSKGDDGTLEEKKQNKSRDSSLEKTKDKK